MSACSTIKGSRHLRSPFFFSSWKYADNSLKAGVMDDFPAARSLEPLVCLHLPRPEV